MSNIEITTLDGAKGDIASDSVEELRARVKGQVLLNGDSGYDEARSIWNAMVDKKPSFIVHCAGTSDVVQAVNFARDNNLLLAIKGAGHNIAGNAVCDGGLMIDLSGMKSVKVHPTKRRAYVDPGATLGDLDHETQAFGLATPLGINSTTGVAGLTLGGGFGWLSRKYGMTVDNLVSADVVTADGQFVKASEKENPDLFWAIRGGGGNFGIVTMFEFQLHPVGPNLLSGLFVFPFDQAKDVINKHLEYVKVMPEDLNVWVVLRKAPPLPFLPEDVHGKEVVILAFVYDGDPAEGEKVIEPIHGFGDAHGQHMGVQPYAAWQQAFDPLLTPGARNYWKSHNFTEVSDDAVDVMLKYTELLPSPQSEIFLALVGGEINKVAPDAMAYAHRNADFVLNV
ncbi:MAG: FAD-binding oxidoreductase, partial [Thermodesulfobacteriota bacterium]